MGRYGRRVSRSLIAALVITLVLGLVSYLKKVDTSKADEPAPVIEPKLPVATPLTPAQPSPATANEPAPATPAAPEIVRSENPRPVEISMAEPATKPSEISQIVPPPSSEKGDPLTSAQNKSASGDLLAARRILNDALLANRLSPPDATSAKKMISDMNQTIVFSSKRFADDEFGGTYSVQSGDVLQKIAAKSNVTWELLLRLNGMTDPKKLRAGQTLKIIHGPFSAVVYKGQFRMDIYLGKPEQSGSMYITSYGVGLGKDDSTPTGTWQAEQGKKLKNPTYFSPRGEGVIVADDPKNPLGKRWIGLAGLDGQAVGKSSYGIHGTIDESSIGKQESMGCIRMHNADIEWVFDLMVEGKSVVVVKD